MQLVFGSQILHEATMYYPMRSVREGFKKKIREFSLRGAGSLPILAPYLLSSSGPGPRSGQVQVRSQVRTLVQGLRTKDLDLG